MQLVAVESPTAGLAASLSGEPSQFGDVALGVVAPGEPLATIYYNSESKAARARQLIEASCEITDAAQSTKRPLIHRVIEKSAEKN